MHKALAHAVGEKDVLKDPLACRVAFREKARPLAIRERVVHPADLAAKHPATAKFPRTASGASPSSIAAPKTCATSASLRRARSRACISS